MIPLNIVSKTEEINLYNQNNDQGHLLVNEPLYNHTSQNDSLKHFQLKIDKSQNSFDLKYDNSKESGNDYMFGIKSPSIKSKYFAIGTNSNINEISKENMNSNSRDLTKKKLSIEKINEEVEKSQKKGILNKIVLEKKLKIEVSKMQNDKEEKEKKKMINNNKQSLFKLTQPLSPKKRLLNGLSLKEKIKKKNQKKNKLQKNNNLNKKFYNLKKSTPKKCYNPVTSTPPVQPNLYGSTYMGQRPSLPFGQFQNPFGHPGIYMNPMNQFSVKKGKLDFIFLKNNF
jgi:hypothetical protein